jgi:uncharacterized damage-inducible protein DinB
MDTNPESALIEFLRFNNWANRQLFQACLSLTDEQLHQPIPGAYGTIRETLEHILRAEAGYLRLLTGSRPEAPFRWDDPPSLATMASYAGEVEEALASAFAGVPPGQMVEAELDGKPGRFQALALFIQLIDHGIEHRTNITTFLNQTLQLSLPIDGWTYLLAQPAHFGLENVSRGSSR